MTAQALPDPVGRVSGSIAGVFAEVLDWARRAEEYLEATPQPAVRDLDEQIEWLVAPALDETRPTIGAGLVVAPGYLAEAPWHLAWWVSPANGIGHTGRGRPGLRRLRAEEDPSADGFHDFTRREWWRVPTETGRPHLTGPYVDYLCTDELTLTITVPVHAGGRLAGVFGADLSVAAIERLAEPVWRDAPGPVTVVNDKGRVVTASDPGMIAGALLRTAAFATVHELPGCWGTLSAVIG